MKTFIDIEKIFNQIGEYKEVNIKKLIEILIDKNKLNVSNKDLKKEEINNIFENIKKLHDFLSGIIGKTEHFSKIINELLLGEYLRITDEEFRKLILELILNNPNIIKDSTQIFIKYFNHIIRTNSVDSIENGDIEINNYNIYFEMIENAFNKDNNIKIRLEQMLLNLFESYFLVFFEEIPNLNDDELRTYYEKYFNSIQEGRKSENLIMLNFSLDMFKNKILKLENIYYKIYLNESSVDKIRYPNIIKLYSIAYIKIYLYKTIYFIFDKNISLDKEILGIIKGESKNEFRKVIKLYIFKLINNFLSNYRDLQNFSFKNRNFDFIEDFKNQLIEEKNEILNYYLIPIEKIIIYKEFDEELDKLIKNNFNLETKFILKYLTEENIDIFYSVIANKILSSIDLSYGIYSQFSYFSQNLLREQNTISEPFKNVISLFTKENTFNSIVKKTILSKEKDDLISIDYYPYEIILTSMRFCVQTTFNSKTNNFYYNLISNNCIYTINNSFIPGIDEPDDSILANFHLLENHLNTKTADHGAYVCSCGCYYEIAPCGFPTESFECLK